MAFPSQLLWLFPSLTVYVGTLASDLSLDKCLQHRAKKNLAFSRREKNEKSGTGNLGKIKYNTGHGSLRVHEIQETSQKSETDLQYVMVSHLPHYMVLHFPLNCYAGAAARQGRPQASINMAIPLSLLLIIFQSPPASLPISLVRKDRLDNLQRLIP